MPDTPDRRTALADELLASTRGALPDLEVLLDRILEDWNHWDGIYRFYHRSFKVYQLQELTLQIRDALQVLMPDLTMNRFFLQILEAGTGREFQDSDNDSWVESTLPVVTAYLNAKVWLETAVRCGRAYDHVDQLMPSDLALLLNLFILR